MESLMVVELIEFRNFKEKITITKKYIETSKVEIIDDRYVYIQPRVRGDGEYARKVN